VANEVEPLPPPAQETGRKSSHYCDCCGCVPTLSIRVVVVIERIEPIILLKVCSCSVPVAGAGDSITVSAAMYLQPSEK
jgi:hypothetical protein